MVGDSITIDSDGRHSAKIAGIYQNYVAHFIYLTPAAYEDIFGDEFEINTVILNLEDNSNAACEATMEEMLKLHGVSAASRTADVKDTYMHSMERVDFVVVVVILCAAALAIVVLYNLSNINMTERIRELATIKVLGFYDIEVTTYLCRENIILTVAGHSAGLRIRQVPARVADTFCGDRPYDVRAQHHRYELCLLGGAYSDILRYSKRDGPRKDEGYRYDRIFKKCGIAYRPA